MQSYTCPNCGAPVKMDDHGAFLECPYCSSQFKPDAAQSSDLADTVKHTSGNSSNSNFYKYDPYKQADTTEDPFDAELQEYADIVNKHVPEFTVNDFVHGICDMIERFINALADHGMMIQIIGGGFFLLVIAFMLIQYFF